MSSRPSRTTRSSTAAFTAPATRSTRSSSVQPVQPTSSTTAPAPPPVRRTMRTTRSTTPAQQEIKPVPSARSSIAATRSSSRASSAASGAAAPLAPSTTPGWNASSARHAAGTETPPQPASKRLSSFVAPGSSLRPSTLQPPKTPGGGLLKRMTSRDSMRPTGGAVPQTPAAAVRRVEGVEGYDGAREPIKAYLRIRPAPPGVPLQSYVQVLNDSEVLMVPPLDHRLNPSSSSSSIYSNALLRNTSHQRLSNLNLDPSSHSSGVPNDVLASPAPNQQQQPDPSTYGALYKFTGVFPTPTTPTSPTAPFSPSTTAANGSGDGTSQASFFSQTALPLVRSFLQQGENCLLFAYGPTGSGKTWTVQGGNAQGEQGLLPRIVEVVWGSLKGKEKPLSPASTAAPANGGRRITSQPPPSHSTPAAKPSLRGLGAKESLPIGDLPDLVPVNEGYEYALFVSYSEIYNEKIYDLLESPLPAPAPSSSSMTSTSTGGGGMLKGLFRNFTTVKRSALSLKAEKSAAPATPGAGERGPVKVVGGLREVRVSSADEAHRVLLQGQSNRRVFSTLANRASSRSHSIFTIKLVRTPLSSSISSSSGAKAGEVISKFSVVDLAGSERVVNTQTTGERLKEAGNINKSLMVLGQCMEVLRKNQERGEGRKPAIVPFRHSKLTEMFQSFFIGEGKAVMIVNINPYSTSFDENSHVMKFSAVARGVMTVQRAGNALVIPSKEEKEEKEVQKKKESTRRVVRMSLVEGGEEEEVVYEEEDPDDDSDGEDEFVNALLDELSALRTALFEAQMTTVLAEANARQRVVREYEGKMLEMERTYQDRMREEAIEAENKLNAKLDILTRLQAAKTPARNAIIDRLGSMTPSTVYDDSDEDEEGEGSDEEEEGEEEEEDGDEEVEKMLLAQVGNLSVTESNASPLAARVKVHVSAAQSPSRSLSSPTTGRPLPLSSSHAAKAPSPLANGDSFRAEEDEDMSIAREEEQQTDSSVVQHDGDEGDEEEEEADAELSRATEEASEADLSRLTEQTEDYDEDEEDEDEDVEDEVVNLSQATEQLGDESEDRSRNSFVDDEAEEDERSEGDVTEGDEQEEDDYAPEADEQDDDDFAASPSPKSPTKHSASPAKKTSTPAPTASSNRQAHSAEDDSFDTFSPTKTPAYTRDLYGSSGKENEPVSTPLQGEYGEDEDGGEDADEFGLDKSMVIRSGSKTKKTKRKLGTKKIHDADDLDSFAEGIMSPIRRSASKASGRSFQHY
ncbi:hypothetical protein JCM6882_001981 [Rhodosporidiobolus microsporus]